MQVYIYLVLFFLNSFSISCLILVAVVADTLAIFIIFWLEHHGLDIISNISLAITLIPPFKRHSINHLFSGKSQVFRTYNMVPKVLFVTNYNKLVIKYLALIWGLIIPMFISQSIHL